MSLPFEQLKQRLEEALSHREGLPALFSEQSAEVLLHELSVYHQELEYQNEELKRIQLELEEAQAFYKDVFERAPLNYLILDQDLMIQKANRLCRETLLSESLDQTNVTQFVHPDSQDLFYLHIKSLQQTTQSRGCMLAMVRADGSRLQVKMQSSRVVYHGSELIRIAFLDVSKEYEQQRKIEALTFRDQLTGLFNRTYYEQVLSDYSSQESLPLGLVMCDVNALKLTNDTFGHDAGDSLLVSAARVLQRCCPPDGLLVRLGGDEFLFLLPHAQKADLEQLVATAERQCSQEKIGAVQLSVSFGYALHQQVSIPLLISLRSAEDMMYQNKLFAGKEIRQGITRGIIQTLFATDPKEREHALAVRRACKPFASLFSLSQRMAMELLTAAFLHDIGKVVLDAELMGHEDQLSEEQLTLYRRHPEKGYRLLSSLDDQHAIAEAILHHHERWDGKGYPMGLKGEDIPLLSRMLYLANSIVSCRNKHLSSEAMHSCIKDLAGKALDPGLVDRYLASEDVHD